MLNPDQLKSPKQRIKAAFERGDRLTTYSGNQIGHTVDFRKIVSTLRDEGFSIRDYWETAPDGRKYKVYYHEKQSPKLLEGNNQ